MVPAFVRKARSAFFADNAASRSMTTYDAYRLFATRSPEAAAIWQNQLAAMDGPTLRGVLGAGPADADDGGVPRLYTGLADREPATDSGG